MYNQRKFHSKFGFAPIILIAILAVLAVGGGATYYVAQQRSSTGSNSSVQIEEIGQANAETPGTASRQEVLLEGETGVSATTGTTPVPNPTVVGSSPSPSNKVEAPTKVTATVSVRTKSVHDKLTIPPVSGTLTSSIISISDALAKGLEVECRSNTGVEQHIISINSEGYRRDGFLLSNSSIYIYKGGQIVTKSGMYYDWFLSNSKMNRAVTVPEAIARRIYIDTTANKITGLTCYQKEIPNEVMLPPLDLKDELFPTLYIRSVREGVLLGKEMACEEITPTQEKRYYFKDGAFKDESGYPKNNQYEYRLDLRDQHTYWDWGINKGQLYTAREVDTSGRVWPIGGGGLIQCREADVPDSKFLPDSTITYEKYDYCSAFSCR